MSPATAPRAAAPRPTCMALSPASPSKSHNILKGDGMIKCKYENIIAKNNSWWGLSPPILKKRGDYYERVSVKKNTITT